MRTDIVADTNVSPFARACNICCGHKFCVRDAKNVSEGTSKREHIVAGILLPTQMFPLLPARAIFVADTNFVSGTQKMFLKVLANEDTLLRAHCCRHKCFPFCPRAQYLLRTQILCPGHKNVSDFV